MASEPAIWHELSEDTVEDDCACAEVAYEGLETIVQVPSLELPLQRARGLYRRALDHDHELLFDPLGHAGVVVINSDAGRILDAFAEPTHPSIDASQFSDRTFTATISQFVNLGLLQASNWQRRPVPEPNILTAWLHVTNACNLRCTYCYLHKTNAAMDEETGMAAVEAVIRSAVKNGFRVVKLKYAGGEATLNFPLVRSLHVKARELAESNGLQLQEVLLSNGVALTARQIDYMYEAGIRLMISLDGIGASHDAQRIFSNGHGSFQHVVRTIERACSRGLPPHLSITVTRHSAGDLAQAVAFALDHELLFNLNFFRDNDCASAFGDLRAGNAEILAGLRGALSVLEARLPSRNLMLAMIDRSSFAAPHSRACGAGHNYLVIDEQGGVARCQMEIEQPVTTVFLQDPLLAVRQASHGFQNVSVDEKEGCRECSWRYWCAGGCSLLTYRATGRTDVRSPNCDLYTALYPEVLRLEGLRLLKWTLPQLLA